MRARLALAALLVGRAVCGADAGLLPGDGFSAGWKLDGRPRTFTGSGLYGHIDGGAELFFEFGFEELTVQRYVRGEDALEVEVYRMRDPTAALGIYLERCGQETPDPGLTTRHTAGTYELLLVQNRYFLIVSNLTGKGELAPTLVVLARMIAARLPGESAVPTLDLLPREGRIAGSERLIRGPLALQSLITLSEGDVLQLGDTVTAVAARYAELAGSEAHTLVVADYASEAAARGALAYLTAHLDPTIKRLRGSDDVLVFRDYAAKFGVARVVGTHLTLTIVLAVEPRLP